MKDVLKYVACGVVCLIIGIVAGSLGKDFLELKWNGEIGPEPFINLIIAVVVAVFLSQSFQKSIDVKKIEHSWVIDPLKDSLRLLGEMRFAFQAVYKSRSPRSEMLEAFLVNHRKFSNLLNESKELAKVLGHKSESSACDELQTKSILYKQAISDGNPKEPFSGSDNIREERNFTDLSNAIMKIIVNLGRKI